MERRQSTLDQVFRVRKRKFPSPGTPSASKSKKSSIYERLSQEVDEISNCKKGNLEAFLFTAKHEETRPSEGEPSGRPREHKLPKLRRGEVEFSSSKPWLTPCSLTSRPASAETVKDESTFEGEHMATGERTNVSRTLTQSPVRTQIVSSQQSPAKTQVVEAQTPALAKNGHLKKSTLLIAEGEANCTDNAVEDRSDATDTNQISQFTNDFLSMYCSGIANTKRPKPQATELQGLQETGKDQETTVHLDRRKEQLLAESHPKSSNYEPQAEPASKHGEGQNFALLESDRRRDLDGKRSAQDGQVEHRREYPDSARVFNHLPANSESFAKFHIRTLAEMPTSSREGLDKSDSSDRHNLFSCSSTLTAEDVVGATSFSGNKESGSGQAGFTLARRSDVEAVKELCTDPEGILTLVRTSRAARDYSTENHLYDSCTKLGNYKSHSPLGTLGKDVSKSSPGRLGEVAHVTPQSHCEQGAVSTSFQEGNVGGAYYRSSVFSPGDEFWDEAIEQIMASKVDFLQNIRTEKNNASLGLGKRTGSGEQRQKSSKGLPNCQESAFHGNAKVQQAVHSQPTEVHHGHCNDQKSISASGRRYCPASTSGPGSEVEGGQQGGEISRGQGRQFGGLPKSNRDGGPRGWFRQLGTDPVSPLPVRRFDFYGKEEDIESRNKQDQDQEKSNTVLSPVKPLGKEMTEVLNAGTKSAVPNGGVSGEDARLLSHQAPMLSSEVAKPSHTPEESELQLGATLATSSKAVKAEDTHLSSAQIVHRGSSPASSETLSRGAVQRSLELTEWLPPEACAVYATKGLKQLYPWQVECLQLEGVLHGRNLVYGASTSAGKSLVAEVLMLKRIVSTKKMALLVLPFVSICSEKAAHLESVLEPLGKRVRSFFGTQGSASVPRDTAVAVCTIEKANSLINKLLEENRLSEVGVIVIDELHMVGDWERGYLLELLLTKVRYSCGEFDKTREMSQEKALANALSETTSKGEPKADLQIIGMSATLPNMDAVAHWLKAALYETDFRPVPLEEFIKVGNYVYNRKMEMARVIRKEADLGGKDPDHVIELCHEVVRGGHSVLVFCASRKACETTAMHIAKYLPSLLTPQNRSTPPDVKADASAAVEELKKSSSGLDPVLEKTLPSGVAYHHAGLTVEEREVVERCFKQGAVKVLTATSTLAAGVNLPARRVIFRQPRVGRDFLDGTRYRQMAGRAGRAGIDTKGESVLICKPEEAKRMVAILSEGCQPLQSCLTEDKIGMIRALLEVVAGGIVQTPQDVNRYVRCTLFNSTKSFKEVVKSVQDSLCWLCRKKFVEWSNEAQEYSTTPLGRAAFGSSLSPEEALVVFEDLAKARESFVLASDLHIVYQVTPLHVELEPDWSLFYQKFVELSELEQTVGQRVGVYEPFLMRMAHGASVGSGGRMRGLKTPPKRSTSSPLAHGTVEGRFTGRHQTLDSHRICKRFYAALMLSKLVQEVPLMDVSNAFKVARGTVQGLQASAGRFAAMVSGFCERLGWHDLEGLVSKFQSRVSFGVKSEIVELAEIPFVKGARARALYKSGFRTIQAVAEATVAELVKALAEASPWTVQDDSRRRAQQGALFGVARKIKVGAHRIVMDRIEEAQIAAFSAMRALGVDNPSSLWSPIKSSLPVVSPVVGGGAGALESSSDRAVISNVRQGDPLQPGSSKLNKSRVEEDLRNATDLRETGSAGAGSAAPLKVQRFQSGHEGDGSDLQGKENQVKDKQGEDVSHDRKGGQHGAANVEPIIQKYRKAAGSSLNCLFGGAGFLREKSPDMDGRKSLNAAVQINSGPIDVDKMIGGFDVFFNQWRSVDEFCFDLNIENETTEPLIRVFKIEGMAICWQDSPVYYVNLSNLPTDGSELANILEVRWTMISNVLSGYGSRKVGWNVKKQLRSLQHPGCSRGNRKPDHDKDASVTILERSNICSLPPTFLGDPFVDVHVVAWLLWPDEESSQNLKLEQEVKRRLPGEVAAKASRAGRWTNQMGGDSRNKCCRQVAQIRALHVALWKRLTSGDLHHPLLAIEMPMVKVLAEMESSGLGVNMDACSHMRQIIKQKLTNLEAEAHQLAGIPFALSVPADVANTVYKHLKLPEPPASKKGKHHISTDKKALEFLRNFVAELKRRIIENFEYSKITLKPHKNPSCHEEILIRDHHPVASVILEHRKLSKLLNSTIASIVTWVKSPVTPPALHIDDDKQRSVPQIFGRWLQTSTSTGRLAMEEPNLQCVEKTIQINAGERICEESGGPTVDKIEINTRQLFVPTQERWVIMSADYSQIEVRLLAHFSEDPALVAILSRRHGDLFRIIASQWKGVSEDSVTEKERDRTKGLVYGIIYGMGVHALAEKLDCGLAEASLSLERFKSAFPVVYSWRQQAWANCRKDGYITTLGGRKRFLEKINAGTHSEQAQAERQAVNSICQGSAADLIKMAMIKLQAAITSDVHEGTQPIIKGHCRLLLQIHDELLLEVDKSFLREVSETLRTCMENAASLKVPLRVKLNVGETWGTLAPFDSSIKNMSA